MSFSARNVLPRLTDLVTQNKADAEERAKLIPLASGVVLGPIARALEDRPAPGRSRALPRRVPMRAA